MELQILGRLTDLKQIQAVGVPVVDDLRQLPALLFAARHPGRRRDLTVRVGEKNKSSLPAEER